MSRGNPRNRVLLSEQPPIDQLLPSSELLAYYKVRVEDFEKERQGLLDAIEKCAVQQGDVHKLEWESRKRADEVRELQKALSDAHTFLFEERQRLLALQAENDSLRLQEIQDRQRIQQLLSINQPFEQEITYNRDSGPQSVTLLPKRLPTKHQAGTLATKHQGGNLATKQQAGMRAEGQERVMRTVFLPTANADFLLLKVESLQAQLNEQKQLAAERIAALLDDRRIRDQEEEGHRAALTAQVEALTERLQKVEGVLRNTTKEYILAKKARQEAEQRAVSADAQLLQERQRAVEEATAAAARKETELESVLRQADSRLDEYTDKFRKEVKEREEELLALENVHSSSKVQYEGRIAELSGRLKTVQKHYEQLESRRQADMQGFTADITHLRRKLCEVDRKLHAQRLQQRLQDDDRLDTILDNIRKRAPSIPATPNTSKNALPTTFSQEMVGELEGIKSGLSHLDRRLQAKKGKPSANAARKQQT